VSGVNIGHKYGHDFRLFPAKKWPFFLQTNVIVYLKKKQAVAVFGIKVPILRFFNLKKHNIGPWLRLLSMDTWANGDGWELYLRHWHGHRVDGRDCRIRVPTIQRLLE
jgi:hypothetical protein